jgi:hypothetical protein
VSNIVDFPIRHARGGPDDWRKHVMIDVLISILDAKDLAAARQVASDALVDVLDEVPA